MAETIIPPADPPVVPPVVTPPPQDEELKKKHDNLQAQNRILERDLGVVKAKVTTLEKSAQEATDSKLSLLKTKLAYEAGLPARLFPLVSGSTEDEIKGQIKLLLDEIITAPAGGTPPVLDDKGNPVTPPPTTPGNPPPPKPAPGGSKSVIDRYNEATPVERVALDRQLQEGTLKLSD